MHNSLASGMTRRTMLKATTATAAGAALFSGSAQATKTKQLNWCGCSQVCLLNDAEGPAGGTYLVIRAEETDKTEGLGIYDGWAFDALAIQEMPFCTDVEGTDKKIIAVTARGETQPGRTDTNGEYHCNPTQCAAGALEAYGKFASDDDITARIPIVDPDGLLGAEKFNLSATGYTCRTDSFGDGKLDFDGEGTLDVVRGGCGTPGKRPGRPEKPGKP